MEVAGSAVGVASLGIQTCQGLLSYYDAWRGYNTDMDSALHTVEDLHSTLTLLEASLNDDQLDESKKDQPQGVRQNAWTELQRARYPFRASTLAKLRELVADVRERLSLAVQVLQLDVSTTSQHILNSVAADTSNLVDRTAVIQTSVAQVSTQNQRILDSQQALHFHHIVSWLSPPDPWINHAIARQSHETQTGSWFLQSDQYRKWKGGEIRHLWLYGKAGCGKTVLCSTVIEAIRLHCENTANTASAAFYFSFSDSHKQSFGDLLLALVAQLGEKGPGRSMLQQAYDKPNRSLPGFAALEEILVASIAEYNYVFVMLDALDECMKSAQAIRDLLEGLNRLSEQSPKLKILATSRELPDIYDGMQELEAEVVPMSSRLVDVDIGQYVEKEMSRNRKLCRLDSDLKALIRETFATKSDGMFRWAYCQLQELKRLKSHKPKFVKAILSSLPTTLDATYERMLTNIEDIFREDALVLLRWLAYAQTPPSLGELVEATTIDPRDGGGVDVENRGDIEDTLNILSGLVTREEANADVVDSNSTDDGYDDSTSPQLGAGNTKILYTGRVERDTKVKLAHFSVKEYLESDRILHSSAKSFSLENAKEQGFLAQSCLTYLEYYSSCSEKSSTMGDLVAFPLLKYSAESWFHHSSLQQATSIDHEVGLLSSESAKLDWLRVYRVDTPWVGWFTEPRDVGGSVYYASYMGLGKVAEILIEQGANVNDHGGFYGEALQAASFCGHEMIVQLLLDHGADANALGGMYGNALQAAAVGAHENIVQLLLEYGADFNAPGGTYGNALQKPAAEGYENIVQLLLKYKADVNAPSKMYGNALQVAAARGHKNIVQLLLEYGADVNAQGGIYGNALRAAAIEGHEKTVQLLLDYRADINARGGRYGYALLAALCRGRSSIVQMLLDNEASVNAQGGEAHNALRAALQGGHEDVAKILIADGAHDEYEPEVFDATWGSDSDSF